MKFFYEGGFLDPAINEIPAEAAKITEKQYRDLLRKQFDGMVIRTGRDGWPIAVKPDRPQRSELLAAAEQKINADTDRKILEEFEYRGERFYLSLENQMNFKAECDLRDSLAYPVKVRTADGFFVITCPSDYLALYAAAARYIRSMIEEGWRRKAKLQDLTDDQLEELSHAN